MRHSKRVSWSEDSKSLGKRRKFRDRVEAKGKGQTPERGKDAGSLEGS